MTKKKLFKAPNAKPLPLPEESKKQKTYVEIQNKAIVEQAAEIEKLRDTIASIALTTRNNSGPQSIILKNIERKCESALKKPERTQKEIQQILELQRGLIRPFKEEMQRVRAQIPADAQEHAVNFLQVIGEAIPLCWIPVADVQMIVKLLHQHMPEPTLRASREQFMGIIKALNEYVGEALERNAKANMPSSFTYTDCAKTGRVKK